MKKSKATPTLAAPKPRKRNEVPKIPVKLFMEFEHVMVDLETLGRRAGCAVLSIGAVAFGPAGLGPEFYIVVNRPSQGVYKLHEDPDTVRWWNQQSLEACVVLAESELAQTPLLTEALEEFTNYLAQFKLRKLKVWGNGSDFDNAILINLYAAINVAPPWEFWNNRCYRTLKNLVPSEKLEREGTYHNALDDAKTQARHAIELMKLL